MVGAIAVIAFAAGSWITHLSWQNKILQKARDGHRLAIDGRLFNVTQDHNGGPGLDHCA